MSLLRDWWLSFKRGFRRERRQRVQARLALYACTVAKPLLAVASERDRFTLLMITEEAYWGAGLAEERRQGVARRIGHRHADTLEAVAEMTRVVLTLMDRWRTLYAWALPDEDEVSKALPWLLAEEAGRR